MIIYIASQLKYSQCTFYDDITKDHTMFLVTPISSLGEPCLSFPSCGPTATANITSIPTYGLMEYLGRRFDRQFTADEVLQLLDRFYNIEMLKSDGEYIDILNHEEEFKCI
ncbi:hypothetical protein Bca52824_011989 [Brassica carinata]|uniref:Uncharacterized protein n=1 Tax=Brassica carinata TaxID=52824 RepID=A0A8X7VWM6_BRACI|nr:hypothetical protein Bca52824_011989 [Brassica carinata]